MNEHQYNADQLAERCRDLIRREAEWAYRDARREYVNWQDEARDAAHDHVTTVLLNDARWTHVAACDISDIALEAANLAEIAVRRGSA